MMLFAFIISLAQCQTELFGANLWRPRRINDSNNQPLVGKSVNRSHQEQQIFSGKICFQFFAGVFLPSACHNLESNSNKVRQLPNPQVCEHWFPCQLKSRFHICSENQMTAFATVVV